MIARALLSSPTVLILDEPTNALGLSEQNELFELVRRLKQQGLCIFYVSHKPAEITEVADRVVGFKQGRITKTLRKGEFDETRLMRLMMGT
jgi:ABC-type sugar transport system ATPase subunit